MADFKEESSDFVGLGGSLVSFLSCLEICIPNTGSFLNDACLFMKLATSYSRTVLPRLTIS